MLENKVYNCLKASSAVMAYSTRIYPVTAPEKAALPFVLYSRVSGDRVYSLTQYETLENPRIQIDVYSTSYDTTRGMTDEIISSMDSATAFNSNCISEQDFYDDKQRVYRHSLDFSCWNRE